MKVPVAAFPVPPSTFSKRVAILRIKSLPCEGSSSFFRVAPKIIVFRATNSSCAFSFLALSIAKRSTISSGVCPPSSANQALIPGEALATEDESMLGNMAGIETEEIELLELEELPR